MAASSGGEAHAWRTWVGSGPPATAPRRSAEEPNVVHAGVDGTDVVGARRLVVVARADDGAVVDATALDEVVAAAGAGVDGDVDRPGEPLQATRAATTRIHP